MIAANTTTSRLKLLIFTAGIGLGLVAFFAMMLALTWTSVVAYEDNTVFAESPSVSQPDQAQGSMGSEDASSASPTERHEMAVWLTRMAIGLSSDSAVSYLAYVYSIAPPDQMSTTPTWTISE